MQVWYKMENLVTRVVFCSIYKMIISLLLAT
jgi:hypothetical protein